MAINSTAEHIGQRRPDTGAKRRPPNSSKPTPGRAHRCVKRVLQQRSSLIPPCRRHEPHLTRPQRAIVRQLYGEQKHTNKEIADYLKCDTRDVHYAIHNESNDVLEDDERYYNESESLRQPIDVDSDQGLSETYLKAEEAELMEVDEKLFVDLNDIEDSENEMDNSRGCLCLSTRPNVEHAS